MSHSPSSPTGTSVERWLLLVGATAIAVISARYSAGSWHDGSRLATVECLVDYHTLVIDQSIYVQVPSSLGPDFRNPYASDTPSSMAGTFDRVQINGRFYSHQTPVPALLMAVEYQLWRWCSGLTARERPDLFYFVMTLGSSGLAYVAAVVCIHGVASQLGLECVLRLSLPISLAVSTTALIYVRNVNNHMMVLGIASFLALALAYLSSMQIGRPARRLLVVVGSLAGLGYAFDPAVGAPLVLCTAAWVAYRFRNLTPVGLFALGAVPWILVHHVVNYAVGGTLRPYGSVPEYLAWPGSAFDVPSMTGVYNHPSLWQFITYALGLLFGERGFLIHNPPLLLALTGGVALLRRCTSEVPEVLWAVAWSIATWLLYGLFSNNYSGQCYSIRWFIPLLAPGFLVLAIFLKHFHKYRWAFVAISAWGAIFAINAWTRGPWRGHP